MWHSFWVFSFQAHLESGDNWGWQLSAHSRERQVPLSAWHPEAVGKATPFPLRETASYPHRPKCLSARPHVRPPHFTKLCSPCLEPLPYFAKLVHFFYPTRKRAIFVIVVCKSMWRKNPCLILHQGENKFFSIVATNVQRKDWFQIPGQKGGSFLSSLLISVELVFTELSISALWKHLYL